MELVLCDSHASLKMLDDVARGIMMSNAEKVLNGVLLRNAQSNLSQNIRVLPAK